MPVLQRGDHGGTYSLDISLDLGSQGPSTTTENSVTIPGLLATDDILAVIPSASLNAGLAISHARVTAADTAAIRVSNSTAGALDPAAVIYRVIVARH